ncbi:hypothetical protein BDN72DRAFT_957966 [Pluteus cervinus]|uniref:Uncharacterized protein n=1 Tax=Pluteus cervinus TaxID=181527 RepID=A0ACD3AZU4_9AGAR|nr:hypothetical protein BDN72DRAFT_957966 [Pluteus cervinus]
MSTSTSSSRKVPPLAESGVFALQASIDIDAPREKVWKVLMDWGGYEEWNPFVRNQQLTDQSRQPLPAQLQMTPNEGQHLLISPVHVPPTFSKPGLLQSQSAFEIITVLDHENYRCAWENVEFPRWLMNAERWQMLTEVEVDVDGARKKVTRYETIEVFGGILAYFIVWFVGANLRKGFTAMAEGLKKRSEEL